MSYIEVIAAMRMEYKDFVGVSWCWRKRAPCYN